MAAARKTEEQRELEAQERELLKTVPALQPAETLWGSKKARVLSLAAQANNITVDGKVDERMAIDLSGEIIDFCHEIAIDKAAFITWASELKGEQLFQIPFLILSKYTRAVGD
ncbi:hypothetical protein [Lysinibacter cavernae]|uniref:Uncharacterized protein n=1 Tax=Lysinibacter cavernae TaxID=1640652 RepID=A0A7X5TUN1_9MICO|nr:hypothetical protein [Lysinibacter cavernae]NIH53752.1 hypothetical protein [Lysinibacter cavernae]